MRYILRICAFLTTIFFLSKYAFSETVYFKNGSKLKGDIVKEQGRYIRIKTKNGYKVHFLSDIDHITKDDEYLL